MEVRSFIVKNGINRLKEEYGIKTTFSKDKKLVIFNYDQVKSSKHKENAIVKECRQLILENETWNIVAKSFERFFNWRESVNTDKIISNAKDVVYHTKHDGSIVMAFYYDGWKLVTRNSFCDVPINSSLPNMTWISLFTSILNKDFDLFCSQLDPLYSYIFEICSPYNVIIRYYNKPQLYLLSANSVSKGELDEYSLNKLSLLLGIPRPETHNIKSVNDVDLYLKTISSTDNTFEGLVAKTEIYPGIYIRCKFKTKTYLQLHYLNDKDSITIETAVDIILSGEYDEISSHAAFNKHAMLKNIKLKMDQIYKEIRDTWDNIKDIKDQDVFTNKVKDLPYKSLLYCIRKGADFDEQWTKSKKIIFNMF